MIRQNKKDWVGGMYGKEMNTLNILVSKFFGT
jgi:hypothetical protein